VISFPPSTHRSPASAGARAIRSQGTRYGPHSPGGRRRNSLCSSSPRCCGSGLRICQPESVRQIRPARGAAGVTVAHDGDTGFRQRCHTRLPCPRWRPSPGRCPPAAEAARPGAPQPPGPCRHRGPGAAPRSPACPPAPPLPRAPSPELPASQSRSGQPHGPAGLPSGLRPNSGRPAESGACRTRNSPAGRLPARPPPPAAARSTGTSVRRLRRPLGARIVERCTLGCPAGRGIVTRVYAAQDMDKLGLAAPPPGAPSAPPPTGPARGRPRRPGPSGRPGPGRRPR
jgi:hypothetical protein